MQNIKYQIFISSTYEDLVQERAVVIETVLQLGHIHLGMEAFVATSGKQMDLIQKAIDLSDYFVLIIGDRYGSICENGISFTEAEYNYASRKGKPILTFIKEDDNSSPHNEELEKQLKLRDFKTKARTSGNNSMFWRNKDELARFVSVSLSGEILNNPQIGWIRASFVKNEIDEEKENAIISNRYLEAETLKAILNAKNSIFIAATAMSGLRELIATINEHNVDVPLTFVMPDYKNENVLNTLQQLLGLVTESDASLLNEKFKATMKGLKKEFDLKIIFSDIFIPLCYVAVDYREVTSSSYIQIGHPLLPSKNGAYIAVYDVVRPGMRLYERYREQILIIEESGGKLANNIFCIYP